MMRKITPLRRENYALEKESKRRCETCLLVFRLNAENFPRRGRGKLGYDCRGCRNTKFREAYAANPDLRERTQASSRRTYQAHREARLQKQREYVAKHRKKVNARKLAHYYRNRRRLLAQRKAYREAHLEAALARSRANHQRRKARRFALVLDGMTP